MNNNTHVCSNELQSVNLSQVSLGQYVVGAAAAIYRGCREISFNSCTPALPNTYHQGLSQAFIKETNLRHGWPLCDASKEGSSRRTCGFATARQKQWVHQDLPSAVISTVRCSLLHPTGRSTVFLHGAMSGIDVLLLSYCL